MRVTAMKNIILTLFVQCTTEKRCRIKYPCISGRDSIYIEKLDTVLIPLDADSIIFTVEVPCDDFELKTENGKLLNELKVVNRILSQRINLKPDTVTVYVPRIEERIIEITKPVEIKYVPKFVKFMAWAGGILSLLVIGYIIVSIKRVLR